LDELTTILRCKEKKGQIVLLVFYKVHPSEIRHQIKSVGKAFAKLANRIKDDTKVKGWKEALAQVANLSGWHLVNGASESQTSQTPLPLLFLSMFSLSLTLSSVARPVYQSFSLRQNHLRPSLSLRQYSGRHILSISVVLLSSGFCSCD